MRVLLPITTPLSHFPAGAEVTAEDLDGPLSVADWQRLGHLEIPPAPSAPLEDAPRPTKRAVATPDIPREGN